jgi:hypothetical protein
MATQRALVDNDTISPSSNPQAAPSATITPTHFQHRTTTAAPVHPLIDTATPAINTVPIELDSTPVSTPVARDHGKWNIRSAIQGAVAGAEKKVGEALGHDASKLRADDAAVMAGPPGSPGPEDFEAAKVDGAITPS